MGATGSWEAIGAGVSGTADVSGAASPAYPELSRYTPVAADVGWQVRATVGYRDGQAPDTARRVEGEASASVVGPPSAPQALDAEPSAGQVALRWQVPLSDGDSPITGYQVRSYPGAQPPSAGEGWSAVPGGWSARDTTFGGLTNDTAYAFEVVAENRVGRGERAEASATPQATSRAATCTLTGPATPTVAENAAGRAGSADKRLGGLHRWRI